MSPITKAQGDVTADLLKQIGMNVRYPRWTGARSGSGAPSKEPPAKGGWNIFHTWHAGADCVNPAPYIALDASGDDRLVRLAEIRPGAGEDRRLVRRARPRRREEQRSPD